MHWADGVSTAGPGQGSGGSGKTLLASLGLQLLELILAQSAPCMEIKYWTQIIQVFLN